MKSKVYFIPVQKKSSPEEVRDAARRIFEAVLEKENLNLEKKMAVKVHFGEKGNRTYLPPAAYDGILDVLQEKETEAAWIETCVLYGGKRFKAAEHKKLAEDHGFTRLPVIIADGETGEEHTLVPISSGHHYKVCAIGKAFDEFPQVLVFSHFKGHALAGFGGAIKQLSMGFASKGGKLAMHTGIKPAIWNFLCKHCGLCAARCQVNAIHVKKGEKSYIDHDACLGCGACFSACPHHAVSILSLAGLKNMLFQKKHFREKLTEYALASHQNRKNIYVSFAVNITRGCDCEPRPMTRATGDIGIFVSTDPVAIDTACWDACKEAGHEFKGAEQLDYAQKIGLGSKEYELCTIDGE